MRKVTLSLLVVVVLAGFVAAQSGVRVAEPLDGALTTDASQRLLYIFDDPANIDPATVLLSVDGTHYTVGDPEIAWTPANFVFTPSTPYADGAEVVCSLLVAVTFGGDTVEGLPLVSNFYVDLSAPYMVSWLPGAVVVTDTLQPIDIFVTDDYGPINPFETEIIIEGITYDYTAAGFIWEENYPWSVDTSYDTTYDTTAIGPPVEIDTIITPLYDTTYVGRIGFDPALEGIAWSVLDTVQIILSHIEDIPDYGTPNETATADTFYFYVDAYGPTAQAMEPVIPVMRPSRLVYTSCSDIPIRMRLTDEYGLNLSTFSARIRGTVLDISDSHISVDTLTLNVFGADTFVGSADVIYTPSPQYYNGETVSIELLAIYDVYGNALVPGYELNWGLLCDQTGPALSTPNPSDGITTNDRELPVSFNVTDVYGSVDPLSIHILINTSSGAHYDYTGISSTFFPEVSWDGTSYTFDPATAGITWAQGDTVYVTAAYAADSIDICSPNPMTSTPMTWHFYVADGPQVHIRYPLDGEFSSCPIQPVCFSLSDPDGIDTTSVIFRYEGREYTLATAETIYTYHTFDTLVFIDTTYYFPFSVYQDSIFTFNPLDSAVDAEEIECAVVYGEDLLGNPIWGGEVDWHFVVDLTAPYIASYSPAAGSYAGGPSPIVTVQFGDSVSRMIDPLNTAVTIRGIVFGGDMLTGVTWIDNTMTIDPSAVGLSFTHHESVEVCVTSLFDGPENRCHQYNNEAEGLPYCWSFYVDNEPPTVELVEPTEAARTACATQDIIIKLKDDIAVNPSSIVMIVRGVLYDVTDPELTWDGDSLLTFHPSTPFADGEEVAFSLVQVADAAGNLVAGSPLRSYFIVDTSAPEVIATSPEDGATVETAIDYITTTVSDPSGINWRTAVMQVVVDSVDTHTVAYYDSVVYTSFYVCIDSVFVAPDSFWCVDSALVWDTLYFRSALEVAGNTAMLNLDDAGIDFAPGGASVDVNFKVADDPDYNCSGANLLDYNFSFDITPGWRFDIAINTWDNVITMGAVIGATSGYDDGMDTLAPPEGPGVTPASFLLGDGTRLRVDLKDLEDLLPTWTIWTGTDSGCIRWNPRDLPTVGSFVINGIIDMRTDSVFYFLPGTAILINHSVDFMFLSAGWNLVSVPVTPYDPSVEAVFPMVAPTMIWDYDAETGTYFNPINVQAGHAYFALYAPDTADPDPCGFVVPGTPLYSFSRTLYDGWNTLGSVYHFGGVDFTSPDDSPDGAVTTPIYSFDATTRTYDVSSSIYAGKGYWVYVDLPTGFTFANLNVDAGAIFLKTPHPTEEATPNWTATLTMDNIKLTVGEADGDVSALLMPPAPVGEITAAYIKGEKVNYSRKIEANGNASWTIVVNKEGALSYDVSSLPDDIALTLDGRTIAGSGSVEVKAGEHILKAVVRSKPTTFALHSAVPNPFNSATVISYDLPEDSPVELAIYNIIGQRVKTLVQSEQSTGSYSVKWNGTDDSGAPLPTGVYFYKIDAGSFSSVGKTIYMK